LIAWAQFTTLSCFLRNRQYPTLSAGVTVVCSMLHPIWAVTFVHVLGLGNAGAGYANSITWWLQYIGLASWTYINSEKLGLSAWSILGMEAPGLEGWWSYLEVAFPAFLQSCSEMWFWEVMSPMVGLLGTEELAAQVTVVNVVQFLFMPFGAFGMAGATLVGTAIGEGAPTKAANIVVAILTLALCLSVCVMLLLCLGGSGVAAVYTPDADVQRFVTPVLRVLGFATIWKSQFVTIGGIFRGTGRTKFSGAVTTVAYWGVSFPLMLLFGFVLNLGFFWMWIGVFVGTLAVLPVFLTSLYYMDFQVLADERMKANAQEVKKTA